MQENKQDQKEIQPIPDEVLSWSTVKGFIDLYLEKSFYTSTLKAAYELAEADFFKAYKKRRYLNYDNFIKSKWLYQNRLLNKNRKKEKTQ